MLVAVIVVATAATTTAATTTTALVMNFTSSEGLSVRQSVIHSVRSFRIQMFIATAIATTHGGAIVVLKLKSEEEKNENIPID